MYIYVRKYVCRCTNVLSVITSYHSKYVRIFQLQCYTWKATYELVQTTVHVKIYLTFNLAFLIIQFFHEHILFICSGRENLIEYTVVGNMSRPSSIMLKNLPLGIFPKISPIFLRFLPIMLDYANINYSFEIHISHIVMTALSYIVH